MIIKYYYLHVPSKYVFQLIMLHKYKSSPSSVQQTDYEKNANSDIFFYQSINRVIVFFYRRPAPPLLIAAPLPAPITHAHTSHPPTATTQSATAMPQKQQQVSQHPPETLSTASIPPTQNMQVNLEFLLSIYKYIHNPRVLIISINIPL